MEELKEILLNLRKKLPKVFKGKNEEQVNALSYQLMQELQTIISESKVHNANKTKRVN